MGKLQDCNYKGREIRKRKRQEEGKLEDCNYRYKKTRERERNEKEGKLHYCYYQYKEPRETKMKTGRSNFDYNPDHPLSRLDVDKEGKLQDFSYKYKEIRKRQEKEGKFQDCYYKYKGPRETKTWCSKFDYNPDHPPSRLDGLLVCQILSRLPVKSLMRFKCVSKGWKYMIEEDSHFINLHLTHSQARPALLFLPHSAAGKKDQTRDYSFMLADLSINRRTAKIHTLWKIKSFSYSRLLGPVAGLVCFVNHCAVSVYNVSTREATPWIKSRVCIQEEQRNGTVFCFDEPTCYFGFDPTTRKHKALFVWSVGKFKDCPVCEVLTVGDNTWRIISEVQPYRPSGTLHTYANGSIYWYLCHDSDDDSKPRFECSDGEEVVEYSDESIVAFDIGSEKFRVIPIPEFTISSNLKIDSPRFLEVDGCLAILRWSSWIGPLVELWKFHDHNKAYGTSSTRRDNWTQLGLTLPSYVLESFFLFHSVAGKDQVIFETYREYRFCRRHHPYARHVKFAECFSYDRNENTLWKFKIHGIPEELTSDTVCTTFVESLLRVR